MYANSRTASDPLIMHFSVPFVAIAMLAVGMVSVSAIPLASPEPQTLPGLCLKEGEYCINSQNLSICCEGLTCEASNGMPTAEFGVSSASGHGLPIHIDGLPSSGLYGAANVKPG